MGFIKIIIIVFMTWNHLGGVEAGPPVPPPQVLTISCEVDPNGRSQTLSTNGVADLAVSESDRFIYCKARSSPVPPPEPLARRKRGGPPPPPTPHVIETSPDYGILDSAYITAEAGLDYEHISLRFQPLPDTEEAFIVPIIQDNKVEGPKLFQVNVYDLVDPFRVTMITRRKRDGTHPFDPNDVKETFPCTTILIVDDDVAFYVDCAMYVVGESSTSITFKVRREGLLQSSQSVVIRTEDITATAGEDYQDFSGGLTLGFTDDFTKTVEGSIDIYNDYMHEGPESFKIVLSSPSEGNIGHGSEAVIIITDTDPSVATTGSFTFDKEQYVITEGDLASIQINRARTAVSSANLVLQVRDVDAQSPNDFDGTNPGSITFNNNALTSNQIQIQTVEDSQVERQESFELVLLSNNIEISKATVWIHDDDVRYCFESKAFVVSEGDEAVSLNIVKEGDLQDISELTVYTSNIDALSGTDYTQYSATTLVIAKGVSVAEINIPIGNDEVWEPAECFKVHIEDSNGNMICAANVLIKDDDAMCSPTCLNAGTCVAQNTCLCPGGFTGPTCETALCDPACANGGSCIATNTCSCPPIYTGPICETILCHELCQNDGICIPYTNKCWCPPGFTGAVCAESLCVSPCENQGVCSANGDCLCPFGFTGAQCEVNEPSITTVTSTLAIQGQISVTDIDGAPAIFVPELNIAGSPEREAFLARIRPLLFDALVISVEDFMGLRINLVRSGSIIIEYDVIVPSTSQSTSDDVNNGVANLITTAPLSGLAINPDPSFTFTQARAICPADYCQNGGSCMADSTGTRSVCTCTSSYAGSQCEELEVINDPDLSEGEIGGIVVGLVVLCLLLIVVAVGFCNYMRYKQVKKEPAPYPNTNTLDLVASPYSYPRTSAIGTQNGLMF